MKEYKAPEMEKIEYKSEDVLTGSNGVDNNGVNDVNDIINNNQDNNVVNDINDIY